MTDPNLIFLAGFIVGVFSVCLSAFVWHCVDEVLG